MPFDGKDFALPAVETDATLRVLEQTRALLVGGHCKKRLAADINGSTVDYRDAAATSFCLTGAHSRARVDLDLPDDGGAWMHICAAVAHSSLGAWWKGADKLVSYNNAADTTQDDAVAVIDRAIAARRGELS
jgi:hypothetical protein